MIAISGRVNADFNRQVAQTSKTLDALRKVVFLD